MTNPKQVRRLLNVKKKSHEAAVASHPHSPDAEADLL